MAKAAPSASAPKKAPTKSEILNSIATATNLAKKDVVAVFEALAAEIKKHVGGRGAGVFLTIPGPRQGFTRKKVLAAARPAQKGVKNPFKPGELYGPTGSSPAYNKIAGPGSAEKPERHGLIQWVPA